MHKLRAYLDGDRRRAETECGAVVGPAEASDFWEHTTCDRCRPWAEEATPAYHSGEALRALGLRLVQWSGKLTFLVTEAGCRHCALFDPLIRVLRDAGSDMLRAFPPIQGVSPPPPRETEP